MILLAIGLHLQVQQATLAVDPIFRGRLSAEAHLLWHPESREPIVVVPFAVTADGLWQSRDSVLVTLKFAFEEGGKTRRQERPVGLRADARREVGFLQLPTAGTGGRWKLKADLSRRNRDVTLEGSVEPLLADTVALSDVILGDAALGTFLPLGADSVMLAPFEVISAGRPIELFFQILNRGEAREGTIDLRIRRMVNRDSVADEVLALAFPVRVAAGITSIHRSVDFSRLKGSQYDLVTTVLDNSGRKLVTRTTTAFLAQTGVGAP